MTENEIFDNMLDEAWDEHEELLAYRAIGTVEDIEKGIKQSEEEFNMLMEYRNIGSLDECRVAVERMKPRQPKCMDPEYGTFDCPSCGHTIIAIDDMSIHQNCLMCGQKLNWDFSE